MKKSYSILRGQAIRPARPSSASPRQPGRAPRAAHAAAAHRPAPWLSVGLVPALWLLLAGGLAPASAQTVPAMINYQGTLTDSLGNPATNGYYTVQFRIWDSALSGAGSYIWGRSYPLYVALGGQFNILLNDDAGLVTTPVTPQVTNLLAAFSGPERYLGLTVTANPQGAVATPVEISPRQRLVTAPYAAHAQEATWAAYATNALNAQQLAGLSSTQYLRKADFPALSDQPKSVLKWGVGPAPQKTGIFDYNGKVLVTTNTASPSEPDSGVTLQVTGGFSVAGTVRTLGTITTISGGTTLQNSPAVFTAPTDGFIILHAWNINANYSILNSAGETILSNGLFAQGGGPIGVTVITLPLAKGDTIHYQMSSHGSGEWDAWICWRPMGR